MVVSTATYRNGAIELTQPLPEEFEGKQIQIQIEEIKEGLSFLCPLAVSATFLFQKEIQRTWAIFVGNMTKIKNPDFLIDTCKILQKKKIPFQISIVGEDRDNFQARVIDLGLEKYFYFKWVLSYEEIIIELQKSQIFINTSLSEWQCLAAYEAALSGNVLFLPKSKSFVSAFWDNAVYHMTPDDLAKNVILFMDWKIPKRFWVLENQNMIIHEYKHTRIEQNLKNIFISLS